MRLRAGSWYSVEASHVSVGYTILTEQEMLLLLCLHNYSIFSMHCWLSLSLHENLTQTRASRALVQYAGPEIYSSYGYLEYVVYRKLQLPSSK